jgi:hypothetical protein
MEYPEAEIPQIPPMPKTEKIRSACYKGELIGLKQYSYFSAANNKFREASQKKDH